MAIVNEHWSSKDSLEGYLWNRYADFIDCVHISMTVGDRFNYMDAFQLTGYLGALMDKMIKLNF